MKDLTLIQELFGLRGLQEYLREKKLPPEALIEVDGMTLGVAEILSPDPFKDFEIVTSFSDDDAIKTGSLFEPYPDRWPGLLISIDVKTACSTKQGRSYDQCCVQLLDDCIACIERSVELARERLEEVKVPVELESLIGTVLCYPNQKGRFTVLCPGED